MRSEEGVTFFTKDNSANVSGEKWYIEAFRGGYSLRIREKTSGQISYSQSPSSLNLKVSTILEPGTTGQALVVQKVDSAIHRINHYPVDRAIVFPNTYPLMDSAIVA